MFVADGDETDSVKMLLYNSANRNANLQPGEAIARTDSQALQKFVVPAVVKPRAERPTAPVLTIEDNTKSGQKDATVETEDDPRYPREHEPYITPHDELPDWARYPEGDPDHPDSDMLRVALRKVPWKNKVLTVLPRLVYDESARRKLSDCWDPTKTKLPEPYHERFRKFGLNALARNIIPMDELDMGRCGILRVRYDLLPGVAPVKVPSRRITPDRLRIAYDMFDTWTACGVTRPSNSPFSAPPVIVPKEPHANGVVKYRVAIDYRMFNNLTVKDSYPLPRVDDRLSSTGGAHWFCAFDLQSGFMQMENDPHTRHCTAASVSGRQWNLTCYRLASRMDRVFPAPHEHRSIRRTRCVRARVYRRHPNAR
jgi:hypothetical protein